MLNIDEYPFIIFDCSKYIFEPLATTFYNIANVAFLFFIFFLIEDF